MKKRTIYMLIVFVILCVLAYFAGYHFMYDKSETQLEDVVIQKNLLVNESESEAHSEYYIARMEDEMLHIYKMPDHMIYDSVKIKSIHLSEEEMEKLEKGIIFLNLIEVFEFLENSMS